jgi:Arabinose efflux permease
MPSQYPDPGSETLTLASDPSTPVSAAGKHTILLIAVLAAFLTQFDISAVLIALPTIGAEFHMDTISLSWITMGYILAAAALLISVGKIADIYGRKRVYLYGIVVFTVASFLLTVVPTIDALVAVRILQGCGTAMIFGTGISVISSVFPPAERGRILGIYVASGFAGLTIGPFLGGLLTQNIGWRSIFLFNIPIGIIACLLLLWKVEGEWAECAGEHLDITGSALCAGALILLMTGLSQVPGTASLLLIGGGCVTGLIFALYEMRVPSPVLDMNLLLQNRIFALSTLAALIFYSATFAVTFLLSLALQYNKGLSPVSAGLVLIAQPLAMTLVTPVSGRISDRMDPQIPATAGIALTGAGIFGLVFLSETTPLWYILLCLIVIGIGFGFFSPPNINAIMGSVDKRYYGVANGINGTVRVVGQMLSLGIATTIFAFVIGRVEITPEYQPQFIVSLHWAFGLFAVLCIFGVRVSLMRANRCIPP